jgi:hypothetical protein
MVTLRKVSLRLADHHIGITHGGDGCSRRIVDFDREKAIALGEKALAEAKKDSEKNHSRIAEASAASHDMPTVPEPLETPSSLGGLLNHMTVDDVQEVPATGFNALSERTADLTEDIEEYAEVAQAVLAAETAEHIEDDSLETEEETV